MHAELIIHYNELKDIELSFFQKKYEEIKTALKVATNYYFDNNHLRFSDVCGNEYSFNIHTYDKVHSGIEKSNWSISVWDYKGTTAICDFQFEQFYNQPLPDDVYKKVMEEVELFISGKIRCSDCGAVMEQDKVVGTYYAGSYCNDCWHGKDGNAGVKKQAQADNYE